MTTLRDIHIAADKAREHARLVWRERMERGNAALLEANINEATTMAALMSSHEGTALYTAARSYVLKRDTATYDALVAAAHWAKAEAVGDEA